MSEAHEKLREINAWLFGPTVQSAIDAQEGNDAGRSPRARGTYAVDFQKARERAERFIAESIAREAADARCGYFDCEPKPSVTTFDGVPFCDHHAPPESPYAMVRLLLAVLGTTASDDGALHKLSCPVAKHGAKPQWVCRICRATRPEGVSEQSGPPGHSLTITPQAHDQVNLVTPHVATLPDGSTVNLPAGTVLREGSDPLREKVERERVRVIAEAVTVEPLPALSQARALLQRARVRLVDEPDSVKLSAEIDAFLAGLPVTCEPQGISRRLLLFAFECATGANFTPDAQGQTGLTEDEKREAVDVVKRLRAGLPVTAGDSAAEVRQAHERLDRANAPMRVIPPSGDGVVIDLRGLDPVPRPPTPIQALRSLEWAGHPEGATDPSCPSCGVGKGHPHHRACMLANALLFGAGDAAPTQVASVPDRALLEALYQLRREALEGVSPERSKAIRDRFLAVERIIYSEPNLTDASGR